MPTDAVFTATALAAIVGTLAMAVYAKKPFGLAPGMGLNTFFVFTVCLDMGYSWQFALTAVFLEGIIFILLTLTKVRELIVNSIPASLKDAIGVGIGLYIAFIGLRNCGVIVNSEATSVALGTLLDPTPMLALIGFFITGILVVLNVKGGLHMGILITAAIGIPLGITHFNGVISAPPSVSPIFCKFEWANILSWDMLAVVLTFLFVDMFGTIGTVIGLATKAGMVDKQGQIKDVSRVLMVDAVATVAGACFGSTATTTYIESASGVAEGGRTGLTAFSIAFFFGLALLFSPIFLAIPAAATAPVLVIVGVMMCGSTITQIEFSDYSEAIPAFITFLLMPLTFSISEGIMIGVICYVMCDAFTGHGRIRKISPAMWVLSVLFILRYIFI